MLLKENIDTLDMMVKHRPTVLSKIIESTRFYPYFKVNYIILFITVIIITVK